MVALGRAVIPDAELHQGSGPVRIAARRDRDRAGSSVKRGAGVVAEQYASEQRAPRATDHDQIGCRSRARSCSPRAGGTPPTQTMRACIAALCRSATSIDASRSKMCSSAIWWRRRDGPAGGHVHKREARARRGELFGRATASWRPRRPSTPITILSNMIRTSRRGRARRIVGGVRSTSVLPTGCFTARGRRSTATRCNRSRAARHVACTSVLAATRNDARGWTLRHVPDR